MLQAIERYMKQAIVDRVSSVSSSALVSALVSEQGPGCAHSVTNETFKYYVYVSITLYKSVSSARAALGN